MRLSRALPLLLLLPSTCVDYKLVGPASPGEPALHVSVDVSHDDELTLGLVGWFSTGTSVGTTVRELADSTMVLQDQVTAPEVQEGSRLAYAWIAHYFDSLTGPDSARMRGPMISSDAPPPLIVLPVPRRLLPLRQEHSVGADLILELSPTAAPERLHRISGFWQFEIEIETQADRRRVLSLDGYGIPPSRMHVPWVWLDQSVLAGDSLSATLSLLDSYEVTPSPYRTHVSRQARLLWKIMIVPAS